MLLVQLLDHELYSDDLFKDERISPNSSLPPKHDDDAGVDLRARDSVKVHANETLAVRLGVAVAVPRGHVGWLTGRSTSALKMGLHIAEGKIDAGYRGEIHCFATAQGSPVEINRGDRLCQLVVVKILPPLSLWASHGWYGWQVVDSLPQGDDRGEDGLGSTGLR